VIASLLSASYALSNSADEGEEREKEDNGHSSKNNETDGPREKDHPTPTRHEE